MGRLSNLRQRLTALASFLLPRSDLMMTPYFTPNLPNLLMERLVCRAEVPVSRVAGPHGLPRAEYSVERLDRRRDLPRHFGSPGRVQ
jgi:hypothetical protein